MIIAYHPWVSDEGYIVPVYSASDQEGPHKRCRRQDPAKKVGWRAARAVLGAHEAVTVSYSPRLLLRFPLLTVFDDPPHTIFFPPGLVSNYAEATQADARRFKLFFHAMLEQGIYLAPSPYEAAFVMTAHGEAEISETLEAARKAFRKAV